MPNEMGAPQKRLLIMPKKNACCGDGANTLILACSGASNVGQISNSVMVEMNKKGLGSAYCLAGLGAGLPSFVENLKATKVILIDGCPVACGKVTLEKYGIEPKEHYVITELGIKKSHSFADLEAETNKALKQIVKNS